MRFRRCTSMMVPSTPWGTRSEVSRTSFAFSPKIEFRSLNSGVESVSLFGVTLPTRMEPAFTLAPTRMMPSSSSCSKACSFVFGMSRVIFSGPSLVSRTSIGELLDVDGGEHVLLDHVLGDEDGVLVVVAVPGHEARTGCCAPGRARPGRWRGRPRSPPRRRPSRPAGRWASACSRCPGWCAGTSAGRTRPRPACASSGLIRISTERDVVDDARRGGQ